MTVTRRQLLSRSAAAIAGAVAASNTCRHAAANTPANTVVLALVGAGGRGSVVSKGMASLAGVQFKYVCDVEDSRGAKLIAELAKLGQRTPTQISDLRKALDDKEVDGVVIATPDHWHALAAIWACQAGKDVYVEKPVAYSIWEGRKMIEAARQHKRVLQVGFQNRSAEYAKQAREYLQSGQLGKIGMIKVFNTNPAVRWEPQEDRPVPEGLDWDRWLGPRPKVPYNYRRHRGWTNWYDYCNGDLGNDGSHQLDLLRMVLGDPPAPRFAYCYAGNFAYGTTRSTPEVQEVTYEYPDYAVTCTSSAFTLYNRKSTPTERNGGPFPPWFEYSERIEIYGTDRLMYLGRHGVGYQVFEGKGKVVAECHGKVPDLPHFQNFVDCIRSRQRPNADVEQSHASVLLPQLANIAHRSGTRRVEFDAAREQFINNDAANALVKPSFRSPYCVPDVV